MAGGMTKIMVVLTAVIVLLINGIAAQKLIVGDGTWTVPPSPGFYDRWAAKQNFAVGDTLVFEFSTGSHSVATVTSKEAYEKCDPKLDKNAVEVSEGPYEITLTSAGQYYYFCTIGNHCVQGQKFAANVLASPSDGSDTSPPSPPPPSAGAVATSSISATVIGFVLALLY